MHVFCINNLLVLWPECSSLIGCYVPVTLKTVVDEWLDTYKRSREVGLLVLINFIVRSCGCKGQRLKGRLGGGGCGSKFNRLSFQFQHRKWSAVNYWSPSMLTMQYLEAALILSIDDSNISIFFECGLKMKKKSETSHFIFIFWINKNKQKYCVLSISRVYYIYYTSVERLFFQEWLAERCLTAWTMPKSSAH